MHDSSHVTEKTLPDVDATLSLNLNPVRVAYLLGAVVVGLLLANVVLGLISRYLLDGSAMYGLVPLIKLDEEGNLPTYFSALLLLFAALLLYFITLLHWRGPRDRFVKHWAGLAIIFLYLSIDEAAAVHEHIGRFFTSVVLGEHIVGFFYFAWVIPFIIITLIFAIAYLRFLLHLPSRFQRLFLLAAALFVGGALGLEMISANEISQRGGTLAYLAISTIEECMEMTGVIVLIYTLLSYLRSKAAAVHIRL